MRQPRFAPEKKRKFLTAPELGLEDFCLFLSTIRTAKSYSADISLLRIFFGPVCPCLQLGSQINRRFEGDASRTIIQTVLACLAEVIRSTEEQKYVRAVFAQHLHGCNWHLRCKIAGVLLEDYGSFIPQQLRKCAPAQLVDVIAPLIYGYLSGDLVLRQVTFTDMESLTAETGQRKAPL